MRLSITLDCETYFIDTQQPLDISIPVNFRGSHPIVWGAPKASALSYAVEGFIGDTRKGGSCNVEEYRFIPHCHGTHTECVGHISHKKIVIHQVLKDAWIPSTLITVTPKLALETEEKYFPSKDEGDLMILRESLIRKLQNSNPGFITGLIIRTLPNNDNKQSQDYLNDFPPFLSLEAMEYIVELGVKHLLVDIPSVDRTFDGGYLSVHRKFWNVPLGEHNIEANQCSLNTITEMVYVPNQIEDGLYLLNLQIPAFLTDAAPSRPLLYQLCD